MQIFWISLAMWFDQSVFVVWKSQQLVTQFWINPKTEVICWFGHLRDFALPFYRNLTIQRMSRVWHQPSWVSRTYGCSELEHGTCVPLLLWRRFVGGSKPNKGWFSGTLCNLAWLVLYQHILHVTTVVTTLFTLWVYKGDSHYWERHPTVRGPTVISHCVFCATRFFINLCCSKQGYFKQSYIKQHMKCLNLCNDFCLKILLLHFLKRTFPWTKGSILWQFTSESGIH